MVLWLEAPDAYPMLLGHPFWRRKTKVHVAKEEQVPIPKDAPPLYTKGVHMLDGLADDEVNSFFKDHLKIIPLFDIDIVEAVNPYVSEPPVGDPDAS